MILRRVDNKPLDPSKETFLLFCQSIYNKTRYKTSGYALPVIDFLIKEYNVVLFGYSSDAETIDSNISLIFSDSGIVSTREKTEITYEVIDDLIDDLIDDIRVDYIMIPSSHRLTLCNGKYFSAKENKELYSLKSEFWDYIGTDQNIINTINNKLNDIKSNPPWRLMSWQDWKVAAWIRIINKIAKQSNIKRTHFITCDPTGFYPIFDYDFNKLKVWYFADDFRGTRKLSNSISGSLVSTFLEKYLSSPFDDLNKNTKNFVFAGNILVKKSSGRNEDWYKYLKDINIENSNFYIPINASKLYSVDIGIREKFIKKAEENHKHIIDDVRNHKLFHPGIEFAEMHQEYLTHKYSLILQCVSNSESLSWRIYHYLCCDTLPFIAEEYDPYNMQIPKKFRDLLLVNNSNDIINKINHYNKNDKERINLLNNMKEYYDIENFKNIEYANKKIKQFLEL